MAILGECKLLLYFHKLIKTMFLIDDVFSDNTSYLITKLFRMKQQFIPK